MRHAHSCRIEAIIITLNLLVALARIAASFPFRRRDDAVLPVVGVLYRYAIPRRPAAAAAAWQSTTTTRCKQLRPASSSSSSNNNNRYRGAKHCLSLLTNHYGDDETTITPPGITPPSPPPQHHILHHAALKTRNITAAIAFYSLLGFTVHCKFRAGPARAAWLELGRAAVPVRAGSAGCARLELIEVPSHMLREEPGVTRQRAPDLLALSDVLGYNHVALDVTAQVLELVSFRNNSSCAVATTAAATPSLSTWISGLNARSVEKFGKTLRVAVPPRQQMIGRTVYELAFLYDADGCLVELLHQVSELEQSVESGWEPWNGTGFAGRPVASPPLSE